MAVMRSVAIKQCFHRARGYPSTRVLPLDPLRLIALRQFMLRRATSGRLRFASKMPDLLGGAVRRRIRESHSSK
jgi:hypothetical protein